MALLDELIDQEEGSKDDLLDQVIAEKEAEGSIFNDIAQFGKDLIIGGTKGLLGVLGLPADLIKALPEKTQAVGELGFSSKDPTAKRQRTPRPTLAGGSDFVKVANLPEPKTLTGSFAQNLGEESLLGILPGAAALKTRSLSTVPKIFRNMVEFAKANPFKFLLGEEAISTAVATNRTAQEQVFPDAGFGAKFGVELATSIVTGKFIDAGTSLTKLLPDKIGPSKRAISDMETEAAAILQDATQDVDVALKKLEEGGTEGLTPAAITGDPGLIATEKGVSVTAGGDIKAKGSADTLQANLRSDLETSVGGSAGADPNDIKILAEARAGQASEAINTRIDKAVDNLNAELEGLPSKEPLGKEALAVAAKKEFDGVVTDWRADETRAWGEISEKVPVEMKPIRQFWDDLKEGKTLTEKALNKKSIPKDIDDLIGPVNPPKTKPQPASFDPTTRAGGAPTKRPKGQLKDTVPINELLVMRSKVLARLRAAKGAAQPDSDQISMLSDLQGFILDTIEGVGENADSILKGDDLLKLQGARTITKEGHDKFFRSRLGEFLEFTGKGGKKVDDELFLEKLLKSGTEGGLNADALFKAIPTKEAAKRANDFLLTQFNQQVTDADGALSIANAKQFLKSHASLLARDSFADSKKRIEEVIKLGEKSDRAVKIGNKRLQSVQKKSAAALFIGTDTGKALKNALNSKDPQATMQSLVALAAKDKTGDALNGLRRSFFEQMTSVVKEGENAVPTHSQLNNFIKRNKKAMAVLYDKDQIEGVNKIVDAVRKAEQVQKAAIKGSPTALNQSAAFQFVGRVGGASILRMMGFSTIQATGAGARVGKKIADALTPQQIRVMVENAIFDPQLMSDLLARPTGASINRLRGHLFNNFGVDIGEFEEDTETLSTPQERLQANIGN